MIITADLKELLSVVEKAMLSLAKEFIITVFPKEAGTEKNFLSVKGSNGMVQVDSMMYVDTDVDPEDDLPFAVDAVSFSSAVTAFSRLDVAGTVTMELEMDKNTVIIKCGTAKVPFALKDINGVTIIENCNPLEKVCIPVIFDNKELREALSRGICAYESDAKLVNVYNDAVMFMPVIKAETDEAETDKTETEEYVFEIISIDLSGAMLARSSLKCTTKNPVRFKEIITEDKAIPVNATFIEKAVRGFTAEASQWTFFENQLIIADDQTFYTVVLQGYNMKMQGARNALANTEYAYKYSVSKKELKQAMEIATLNQKDDRSKNGCLFFLKDGKLAVKSVDKSNEMVIPVENAEGEVHIFLNKSRMERALATCGNVVELFGNNENTPVYIQDDLDEATIIITPIKFPEDE